MADQHGWPPAGGPYRDDRLAFLAAQAELRRMSWPWWLRILHGLGEWGTEGAGSGTGRLLPPDAVQHLHSDPEAEARDWHEHRMQLLSLACEGAAERMNEQERADLRATGALPTWFFDGVRTEFHSLARTTRGAG